jgi:hypothetical protein
VNLFISARLLVIPADRDGPSPSEAFARCVVPVPFSRVRVIFWVT